MVVEGGPGLLHILHLGQHLAFSLPTARLMLTSDALAPWATRYQQGGREWRHDPEARMQAVELVTRRNRVQVLGDKVPDPSLADRQRCPVPEHKAHLVDPCPQGIKPLQTTDGPMCRSVPCSGSAR